MAWYLTGIQTRLFLSENSGLYVNDKTWFPGLGWGCKHTGKGFSKSRKYQEKNPKVIRIPYSETKAEQNSTKVCNMKTNWNPFITVPEKNLTQHLATIVCFQHTFLSRHKVYLAEVHVLEKNILHFNVDYQRLCSLVGHICGQQNKTKTAFVFCFCLHFSTFVFSSRMLCSLLDLKFDSVIRYGINEISVILG